MCEDHDNYMDTGTGTVPVGNIKQQNLQYDAGGHRCGSPRGGRGGLRLMGVPARGELVDAAPDGAEVLVVEEKPQLAPGVAVRRQRRRCRQCHSGQRRRKVWRTCIL